MIMAMAWAWILGGGLDDEVQKKTELIRELKATEAVRIEPGEYTSAPTLKESGSSCVASLNHWASFGQDHQMAAYVSTDPSVIVLSPVENQESDARWIHGLVVATVRTMRSRLTLDDDPKQPTILIHCMKGQANAYDDLLLRLAKEHPYLKDFAETAKSLTAFSLTLPFISAVEENEISQRSINRDNNIAHMVARTTMGQYFGFMPFWIREGVSLDVQVQVLDTLMAMGLEDAWDPAQRSAQWREEIQRAWKRRKGVEEQKIMQARIWSSRRQCVECLGLVGYLLDQKPVAFRSFLEFVKEDRDRGMRRDGAYMTSESDQVAALNRFLGPQWREEAISTLKSDRGVLRADAAKGRSKRR